MKVSPYGAGNPHNRLPLNQQRCLNYVQVHGSIDLGQATMMLGLPPHMAHACLKALCAAGLLVVQYVGEAAPRERWVAA